MNKLQAFGILVVSMANLGWLSNTSGAGEPTALELNDALENFRSIKSETLRDPKNAKLLEQLRKKARDEHGLAARVLLLRVDDETVVQACLERLRSPDGELARGQFELAGNPKLIAALAPDFNRDETAVFVRVGGDQIKFSASMIAAVTVKGIILASDAFSPEVKAWAKSLPEGSADLRTRVRQWWEANKVALAREDYRAVVPIK